MAIARLSDVMGVSDTALASFGVMNSTVAVDNPFFIEPRLLLHSKSPFFLDAAAKIEAYFQKVIALLRASKKRDDLAWKTACQMLRFREPKGFALGYGVNRPDGRGVGPALASGLASRAKEILALGLEDPLLFEVVQLFTEGFGPDLISDTQASILQENFVAFSQHIADKLKVTSRATRVVDGRSYQIPSGPTGRGLILIPQEFLTPLPVDMPWESYEFATALDDSVRKQLSDLFATAVRNPTKSEIARVIFPHARVMDRMVQSFRTSVGAKYDFESDPMGVLRWLKTGSTVANSFPESITLSSATPVGLSEVVTQLIAAFKQRVEQDDLWKDFYRDDYHLKGERYAQLLFFSISDSYCDANSLEIVRVLVDGQSSVDFKLSATDSFTHRVEVRFGSNPKLWTRYDEQMKSYASQSGILSRTLVLIKVRGRGVQFEDVVSRFQEQKVAGQLCPTVTIVDASLPGVRPSTGPVAEEDEEELDRPKTSRV